MPKNDVPTQAELCFQNVQTFVRNLLFKQYMTTYEPLISLGRVPWIFG
jgi:hypothetical protein